MLHRGKLVVIAIFAIALLMATFALVWNWGLGRRSLEIWGQDGSLTIRDAKQVRLLRLERLTGEPRDNELFEFPYGTWGQVESKDISRAPGLVHARHAFLEDASFQWQKKGADSGPLRWEYAVQFQGNSNTTILLDLSRGVAHYWEGKRDITLSAKTAEGWKKFTARHFPDNSP